MLKDLTIVAYFDDPIFPYALRELINNDQNKNLFSLNETPIP